MRIAALALAAAACQPQEPPAPQPPQSAEPAPAPPAFAQVTSLAGEWRVAGIDGKPLEMQFGIALRGSDREIWWEPRCAGFVRSYTIEGTRFATGPYIGFVPPKPNEPGPPVCLIAPPPQMGAIFEALNAGNRVGRTANNGIEISGGGHSLLLFSQ